MLFAIRVSVLAATDLTPYTALIHEESHLSKINAANTKTLSLRSTASSENTNTKTNSQDSSAMCRCRNIWLDSNCII